MQMYIRKNWNQFGCEWLEVASQEMWGLKGILKSEGLPEGRKRRKVHPCRQQSIKKVQIIKESAQKIGKKQRRGHNGGPHQEEV